MLRKECKHEKCFYVLTARSYVCSELRENKYLQKTSLTLNNEDLLYFKLYYSIFGITVRQFLSATITLGAISTVQKACVQMP